MGSRREAAPVPRGAGCHELGLEPERTGKANEMAEGWVGQIGARVRVRVRVRSTNMHDVVPSSFSEKDQDGQERKGPKSAHAAAQRVRRGSLR